MRRVGIEVLPATADSVARLNAEGARMYLTKPVDVDQFFENYILIGDYDMTVFSWIGTPFPISSSSSIYAEPQGEEIQRIASTPAVGIEAVRTWVEQAHLDDGNAPGVSTDETVRRGSAPGLRPWSRW